MSIKGFRLLYPEGKPNDSHYLFPNFIDFECHNSVKVIRQLHTGTVDRNGEMIFEGDLLRSKTCEIPFKVENIVDFLIMCGRYEEKHGTPIFDSLEVVPQ